MTEMSEVVIIGGGIVGCATGYFLAQKGVQVTIIEKEAVGSCASGFAAGLLNPLYGHGIPGPLESLARESFGIHLSLSEEVRDETGVDPRMEATSSIWVAFNEAETEEIGELFRLTRRMEGFPAQWLDGTDIRSLESRVSPSVMNGMRVEGTRQVSSYEYTLALSRAAEKRGATIRHGTVRGLRQSSDGQVTRVVLENEEVACDKVVIAMGPWTGQVEGWLGIPVPVDPLKGQILRLELTGPPLEHSLYHSRGGYVSAKPDGLIWVGTTEEHVGFDDQPTQEARESILKEATRVMPVLSEAEVALQTACLRPVSEDGLPIIGEVPGRDGVYLATGAGRKGILLGPAMARATADLITDGHTNLPIEHFSPRRFALSS